MGAGATADGKALTFGKFLQKWGLNASEINPETKEQKEKRSSEIIDLAKLIRRSDKKAGKKT